MNSQILKIAAIFLGIAVSFVACSVSRLPVDVKSPPEQTIPGKVSQIYIVNLVAGSEANNVHLITDFMYSGEARDGSSAICSSLGESIACMNSVVDPAELKGDDQNQPISDFINLPKSYSYFSGSRNTLVFVVDYFYANFSKSANELQVDSAVVFIAKLNGHIETRVYSYYFDSDGNLFTDIPAYNGFDDIEFQAQGTSEKDAKSNLISKRDAVEDWGASVGRDYCSRFCEHISCVNREFITSGDPKFKEAYKLIKDGSHTAGKRILDDLTKSENLEIVAKAYYNLAVYFEFTGDTQKALNMVELSLKTKYLAEAREYKYLLIGK